MVVLKKYVITRLVDIMTGAIIVVCGGGIFEPALLGWRQDEDYTMETEAQQVARAKVSFHWNYNQIARKTESFSLPVVSMCMLITHWHIFKKEYKFSPF